MAEQRQANEKLRLQFRHKDFFYSIPEGMALVKKNFITGKITDFTDFVKIDKDFDIEIANDNLFVTNNNLFVENNKNKFI